jgi:hypothetical protein
MNRLIRVLVDVDVDVGYGRRHGSRQRVDPGRAIPGRARHLPCNKSWWESAPRQKEELRGRMRMVQVAQERGRTDGNVVIIVIPQLR